MADDEKPGWTQVRIRQPVDSLFKFGPSIQIGVLGIPSIDGGEPMKAMAQIDTGAAGTGISVSLANRLNLRAIASGEIHHPDQPPTIVPYFRVRFLLPSLDIELDVARLPSLDPPHDVLFGRDLLAQSRFIVDFTTGVTAIQFKNSP